MKSMKIMIYLAFFILIMLNTIAKPPFKMVTTILVFITGGVLLFMPYNDKKRRK